MSKYCYYCGAEGASRPLQISPTFTAGGMIKVAHSDVMCDRCHGIMFGDIQRVWYHNKEDDRWVKLYLRGVHQLWQGDTLLEPRLGTPEEHTQVSSSGKVGKPETYRPIFAIPKRVEVREWLLNPPEPPFTIAIAESGQKHVLFLAQTAYSRDCFPVQFEMDQLVINSSFKALLGHYEALLNAGFSKTEIDSGEYRADRVMDHFAEWNEHDPAIARERYGNKASRLLQLISFVSIKPEYVDTPPEQKVEVRVKEPKKEVKKEERFGQLSLF